MKRFIQFSGITFLLLTCVSACKKEDSSTVLRMKLTDAPAAYEEVNIDLKSINIKLDGDTSNWISITTIPGVYNLLSLQNGIDTLIAQHSLPLGNLKEIRLVLGDNNSIRSEGETYPLTVPSGSESGLKIKLNKQLRAPIDSVTIDFDAALSIFNESGGYKLKPVVRIKER